MTIDKLKDSKQFLRIILENMDTAVFIVDTDLKIYQFNKAFHSIFHPDFKDGEHAAFGSTAGCINAMTEGKPCGKTKSCDTCELRKSLLKMVQQCRSGNKQSLERIFYINGRQVKKHLEFTCRPIEYDGRQLALVFIYDVTLIEASKRQLKKKQRQIDIDLEKASEIQRSLLPDKRPDIPEMNVDWFFEPSHKVGGDVFHIYREKGSFISCYMLDVSGHGVSASLVAVMVKQFLDYLHIKGLKRGVPYPPKQILQLLERQFPFERFDSYFTIVCLLLNWKTGELLYSNAGHVPPVLIRQPNGIDVLGQHGSIIGIGLNADPQQYETVLTAGDKLVIYTDGLVDYFGRKGESSNIDNFYSTLQAAGSCSATQSVTRIISQRNAKGGNSPADDISLMVLEYLSSTP